MGSFHWVTIAHIGRAIGLKGSVAVYPFGKTLSGIDVPSKVHIGTGQDNLTEVVLDDLQVHGKKYSCHFEGVDDRSSAERLREYDIYFPANELCSLDEDEYYHFELEGMDVMDDMSNEIIGKVKDVLEFPTMDALEVVLNGGKGVVIPFTRHTVPIVDKEQRKIVILSSVLEEIL
jgi:16S rRNA processing protein RimM